MEKWSLWSDSNRNLKRLRTAVPRSFGVLNGEIIFDLLSHINDAVGRYAVANACPMETAYFAADERYSHPAHCKTLPPRKSCDFKEKSNMTASLVKPRHPETVKQIPHVVGKDLSSTRLIIVDTGATYDMANKEIVEKLFPECIRNLHKKTIINIANGKAYVEHGVKIRSGTWDCVADNIMMPNCPNLMSVGQRVLNAGFTHIWVREKFPCFISPCCRMIIIFDINGVIPCYSPCMEEFEETMLGSFDLASNMFKDTCGITVGRNGLIAIAIAPLPGVVF